MEYVLNLKGFYPISNPFTKVNSHELENNCYFCMVAALSNITTTELVGLSGWMQYDTASHEHILTLLRDAGIEDSVIMKIDDYDGFVAAVKNTLPCNHGLGVLYTRAGTERGHALVIAKDENGEARFVDYQKSPPTILTSIGNVDNVWVVARQG